MFSKSSKELNNKVDETSEILLKYLLACDNNDYNNNTTLKRKRDDDNNNNNIFKKNTNKNVDNIQLVEEKLINDIKSEIEQNKLLQKNIMDTIMNNNK